LRISVTFRHLDPSDALKDYVSQKLSKVNKYFDGPIDANAVLSVEKFRQIAEVTVTSGRFTVNCTEETDDMYQSIDKVIDKVERQVKRQRQKVTHKKGTSDPERMSFEVQADNEEAGAREERIVKSENVFAKPMSLDEAMLQMDANKAAEFMVFSDASTRKINVLYRRKDGDFGLIETSVE
jgi:putative sigma-54 modulation protein